MLLFEVTGFNNAVQVNRSKVDGAVLTTEARLKAQVVARQARQASSDLCPLKETSAW